MLPFALLISNFDLRMVVLKNSFCLDTENKNGRAEMPNAMLGLSIK